MTLISKKIEAVQGDITTLEIDAIVNAANTSLLGGGGVDGAIHRAAGPELLRECRTLGGCPTGEAKITKAYKLPSRYVVHTAGPVWRGGKKEEDTLLKNCYLNSLSLCQQNKIKTIAFPGISTGVYRFPKERAAQIAVTTVSGFLKNNTFPKKVIFVCFSDQDLLIYQKTRNYSGNHG